MKSIIGTIHDNGKHLGWYKRHKHDDQGGDE